MVIVLPYELEMEEVLFSARRRKEEATWVLTQLFVAADKGHIFIQMNV